jgi:hypothetical protein
MTAQLERRKPRQILFEGFYWRTRKARLALEFAACVSFIENV